MKIWKFKGFNKRGKNPSHLTVSQPDQNDNKKKKNVVLKYGIMIINLIHLLFLFLLIQVFMFLV